MKIEKNKIVFASVLLTIVLFIFAYSMMVLETGDNTERVLKDTEVPKLEQQQKEYSTKLEAVDNIPENRIRNAPSVYNEKFLDSTGLFDPDFPERDKQRIVDSIYNQGRIDYAENRYRDRDTVKARPVKATVRDTLDVESPEPISSKELALEHQLFFASAPRPDPLFLAPDTQEVLVEVDGHQVLKTNGRLRMRLLHGITLGKKSVPKNTLIYGIVSFQPNRTLIKIDNIDHIPVKLMAHDIQDGLAGIYIENSFRGEVANEVVGDLIDDINIAGVPQVSGIKKVFQRNNRNVKVEVANNYKLILKVDQRP